VEADGEWFFAGGCSFLLFSSLPEKVHACPLFFRFFNFSPYVFDCLFSSLVLFIKVFYVFNLALILLIFFSFC